MSSAARVPTVATMRNAPIVVAIVSVAACAAPQRTPSSPSTASAPADGHAALDALFDTLQRFDDDGAIAILKQHPALASARDAQGRSVFFATLARIHGKGFVRPQENRALAALLALRPTLDAFQAAAAGDVGRVEDEIALNPAFVRSVHEIGWTPLHFAAFGGQPRVVEVLLAHGAEINRAAANEFANSPLQVALLTRQPDVVRVLIEHGADVSFKQSEGFMPLHEAAQLGDAESVRLLLDAGADPNVRTPPNAEGGGGMTPAELASREGHADVVALLDAHTAEAPR
jgi:hypothetical protein